MKKIVLSSITMILAFVIAGCSTNVNDASNIEDIHTTNTIVYGKAAGPYTVLFEDAIIPILEKQGFSFNSVEFSDVLQSNTALNDGSIMVNVEQHTAYMENFNESQNANLVALTPIPTVPAGIFSQRHDSLEEVGSQSRIAIPNDVSNAARGYLLLQKAGWIVLDDSVHPSEVTRDDIIENPYDIDIIEMDSSNIPRSMDEFDYAVIPGSIVYNADIDVSTVLLQEDILEHLLLQVVVKEDYKDTEWAKAIVDAYHSEEFKEYMRENESDLWFIPEPLQ